MAFNTSPKHKLRLTKIQKQNPGIQTGHVIPWEKELSQLYAGNTLCRCGSNVQKLIVCESCKGTELFGGGSRGDLRRKEETVPRI